MGHLQFDAESALYLFSKGTDCDLTLYYSRGVTFREFLDVPRRDLYVIQMRLNPKFNPQNPAQDLVQRDDLSVYSMTGQATVDLKGVFLSSLAIKHIIVGRESPFFGWAIGINTQPLRFVVTTDDYDLAPRLGEALKHLAKLCGAAKEPFRGYGEVAFPKS